MTKKLENQSTNQDSSYFLKQKKTFVSLVIILNLIHLFINSGELNSSFNPIFGVLILGILLWINVRSGSSREETLLLSLISITYGFQVLAYFINGFRIADYINLIVIKTNIPDLVIFFTLLTYILFKAKSYLIKN